MRIVIADSTDRWLGGVETYIGQLIPALLERGHEVLFLHEGGGDPGRPATPSINFVPQLSCPPSRRSEALLALAAWRPDVLFVQAFADPDTEAAALALAPGVFFAHAYYGTCISGNKAFRIPDVRACDRTFGAGCLGLYLPRRCGGLDPRTMLREYRRQVRRLASLQRYQRIVTFSAHMRQEYLKHGFSDTRVRQLPPVYPSLGLPAPQAVREPHDTADGRERRLSYIGRLERLKGVRVLLAALPLVREHVPHPLRLTIAGDGPELAACREDATRLALTLPDVQVDFVGWAAQEDCAALVTASDVVVMPSVWPEPFGFAGAEAVQRGVPVAAFDVGAVREWLTDDGTGAVAPSDPPSARGLATAIVRALAMPRRQVKAGTLVASHAVEQHVTELLEVLDEAAGTIVRAPEGMK